VVSYDGICANLILKQPTFGTGYHIREAGFVLFLSKISLSHKPERKREELP
jgi:hypothetical protein